MPVRCCNEGGLVVFDIRKRAQTASTNDDAAALLGMPEHAGAVIVADFQSDGRGRHARPWVAPPGSSLLFTTILPHAVATDALWAVTLWTALCVAEGIEAATGIRVGLQWPNDLLMDGRKCAGILCISRVAGSIASVGCGTGINVIRPDTTPELDAIVPPPAFLSDLVPEVTRDAVLDAILAAYARRSGELATPSAIARAWEARAALDGTRYRLQFDGETVPFEATARRIAGDGSLVVVDGSGRERVARLADARVLR